jgi:hypothetical protein
MPGDEYATSLKIHTSVTTMIRGVSEEHTCNGTVREFMGYSGSSVRIAKTTKRAKLGVCGWRGKEGREGAGSGDGLSRESVEDIGGGMEGFDPIGRRHASLKQQVARGVVNRVDDALSFAILRVRVGT